MSADIVEAMRPLRMARDLRLLPRRQPGIELLERDRSLALDAVDFLADGVAVGMQRAQLVDLGLELGHRFFEIEVRTHRFRSTGGKGRAAGAAGAAKSPAPCREVKEGTWFHS